MKYFIPVFFFILSLSISTTKAQDSTAYSWGVTSRKIEASTYQLLFQTKGNNSWELYGPNEILSEVPAVELEFQDSSIQVIKPYQVTGDAIKINSPLFDNASFTIFPKDAIFIATIRINGTIPAQLLGTFRYTYGKGEEFYPLNPLAFSVALEGGLASSTRIKIPSLDLRNPVNSCGDDITSDESLISIFLIGFVGGLIALLTPCVFPLIPLTVSFFTKQSKNKKQGIFNALIYGFFIFLIYILLSLPFHFVDQNNPEILNNISTNIWLNLLFFVVFVVFAISFFGYFEITLPGSVANTADSRSGAGNIAGIFFMALTLAIVSFSCTGPILGTLLVGALSSDGGPLQLTFGMGGFGFGLALPFALFAMFPGWLKSLPKSGGWLNSVKVVLGFLELAMAVKFLSNADLVKQWGFLKRETFMAIWVLIGASIVLYLLGKIRFPHDSPIKKFGRVRIAFVILFTAATLYLVPGVTNTTWANLKLISGFPPPLCYSIYKNPVNCEKSLEPLRDYEEAILLAKKENKPVLIDFTGWACVNCRRMEEKIWTDEKVHQLMKNDFIVVSLYVDERRNLPASQQITYTTKTGGEKNIITVGDKWATFQSENFDAVSQPQYAIVSPGEKVLTRTKTYTDEPDEFETWLRCGLDAFRKK